MFSCGFEWEEEKDGDGVKWTFLEHKGPVFAPPYEPLPNDIGFYYDGKEKKLSLPAEEVATFYARMSHLNYTASDVFNHNFFKDWKKTMNPEEKSIITDLSKCNFEEMYKYFEAKKKKKITSDKEAKKEAIQKEYGVCILDGHEVNIDNFKIEKPGLFRGRGDIPKQGMLKMRINPEDVTVNCSSDSKIPQPPAGHRWKKVLHDNKLALSVNNEKEQGETADTVGCCSLRVEHIKLHDELDGKEKGVEFDILGKDNIRYYKTVSVDKQVYKNVKLFVDNKQPKDYLFDHLNTSIMNEYLNSLMKGLTSKVFRTYNASKTLQEQLNLLTNPDDPVPAKLQSYNRAVAILYNHQRSVPANISEQMEGLQIKDENHEIARGTFKFDDLDPRISVAWCKRWHVPIAKIYNEAHLTKFSLAIDLTEPNFDYLYIYF